MSLITERYHGSATNIYGVHNIYKEISLFSP